MLVHHPSFLFAFFTLLIPILIHFLNLRKPKQIYFTNVAFLKNIDRQSSRKIKLKDWWLLITRLLFLNRSPFKNCSASSGEFNLKTPSAPCE